MADGEVIAAPTLKELEAAEARMRSGFAAMVHAMFDVHRRSLYRAAGFEEFLDYCRERHGFGRSHSYRMLSAGELLDVLPTDSPIWGKLTHEGQLRDLEGMATKGKVGILERAAREAEKRKAPLTGKLVMEIARRTGWKSRAEFKAEQREKRNAEKPTDQKMAEAATATRDALEAAFAAILQYGDAREIVELVGDPGAILGFEATRVYLNDMADSWPLPE